MLIKIFIDIMLRPLVISPCFFTNGAVGQVERHFFLNLDPKKYHPVIICASYDEMRYEDIHADVIVVKECKIYVYMEKILRNLHMADLATTPDYKRYSWNIYAKKAIKKLVNEGKFDFIHTISFPCSTHLLGEYAKKISGKPWIAQFYDPWYDNPLRPIKSQFFKKYDLKLEHDVTSNANIVLHSNSIIIESWNHRYPTLKDKFIEIPFITNESGHVAQKAQMLNDRPIIISHIGSLYTGRTIRPLIYAIATLDKTINHLKDKLHFTFVGTVTQDDIDLINKFKLDGFFTFTGRVDELECRKYYEEADYFLAVDCYHDFNCFFPSKILKYFCYAKPIIGLVKKGSVLESEMERSSNVSVNLDDVNGIVDILKEVATGNEICPDFDVMYWMNFSIDNVLRMYDQIVECKIIKQSRNESEAREY